MHLKNRQIKGCLLAVAALFVLCTDFSPAQISITSLDAQSALTVGRTITVQQTAGNVMVTVGSASSTPQVWDFTGFTYKPVGENTVFSVATAAGSSNFPGANLAIRERFTDSTGTTYTFFSFHDLSSSSYGYLGLTDDLGNLQATFNPPIKELQFPLTTGTTWSYNAPPETTAVFGFKVVVNRTVSHVVDAFGTLHLPHGTFSTLREKIVEIQTIFAPPIINSRTKLITYNFLTKEWGGISVTVDSTQEPLSTAFAPEGIIYSRPEGTGTAVEQETDTHPGRFLLAQNFPNPFNPVTVINYTISGVGGQGSGTSRVKLAVYDLLGREIAVLVNEAQAPGSYAVRFEAGNLSSGAYLYRLTAGQYSAARTMVLTR